MPGSLRGTSQMATFRPSWSPSAAVAYGVAILSVTAALVTALLLDKFLQTMPYVSLLLCALMFVTWFGGLGPGVFATVLAALYFIFFLVDSTGALAIAAHDIPRVALFVITALFVVSLSAAQRRNGQELVRVNEALMAQNAERKRVEAYLDEAQTLSRTGSFGWKLGGDYVFWSREARRILEIDRDDRPTIEQLMRRVHPDDHPVLQAEVDRAARGERDYAYELRWLAADGATRHLRIR